METRKNWAGRMTIYLLCTAGLITLIKLHMPDAPPNPPTGTTYHGKPTLSE